MPHPTPYIDAAATLLDLPIPPTDRDAVIAAFTTLLAQAALVTRFPLPETIEAAPRFIP